MSWIDDLGEDCEVELVIRSRGKAARLLITRLIQESQGAKAAAETLQEEAESQMPEAITPEWTFRSFEGFWDLLAERARAVLTEISTRPDGYPVIELPGRLRKSDNKVAAELDSGHKIAGALSSVGYAMRAYKGMPMPYRRDYRKGVFTMEADVAAWIQELAQGPQLPPSQLGDQGNSASKATGLPHSFLYRRLIQAARAGQCLHYGEVAPLVGLNLANPKHRDQLARMLGEISSHSYQERGVLLSAVVTLKNEGDSERPGEGFFELARQLGCEVGDDAYLFWATELQRVFDAYK